MGLDLPEAHAQALDFTRGYVRGIRAEQLSSPTPCDEWDVRELLNHVVAGNFWAAELGAGKTIDEVGDRLDGDVLGDDLISAYDRSAEVAAAVFQAPGAMQAPCAVSYGPVPGEMYCGHRLMDVLIHGWDLASATGQDTKLPPELVDACWDVVEPQLEILKASGMFGDADDLPSDAGAQDRLLAVLGRQE